MKRTCTVVNFDNLHSLLALLGSLFFKRTTSSDWRLLVIKNSSFSERTKALLNKMFISTNNEGYFSGEYFSVVKPPYDGSLLTKQE